MSRKRHPESRPQSSVDYVRAPKAQHTARFPHRYLYSVITCSLLVTLVAVFILYGEYREQRTYWHEKLTRVADVNQRLLQNWVKERNEDAELLASFPCTAIGAVSGLAPQPAHPRLWQKRLHQELVSVSNTYAYAGVYVLDGSGRVVAQSEAAPALPPDLIKKLTGSSQPGSLTIPKPGGGAGYSQLAFVNPILYLRQSGPKEERTAVVGHVVLLTRAEAIASLLVADAGATVTGETVLLTLHLNQPVFVSPLRHWHNRTAAPTPPLASPGHITLIERRELFGTYRDYRGVTVLAATRFLPDLGWAMVTKVDRSEALSPFQQTLILGIAIVILTILTITSLAATWLRQQHVQRLQTDLARGRQTEEDLRRSEERFWVALQNSPVVVFNQDRELRYTWVHNPQPPWSEQDYYGKTDEEILGIEEGSRLTALKQPVLDTGVGARKEWTFAFRGETRVFDINIQPLRNQAGEVVGITCASMEVTEHKRTEEELKKSESKYRRLFETTEAFGQTDMAGNLGEFNPAFQHMTGYSAQELAGLAYCDLTPSRWHAMEAQIIQEQVLPQGHSAIYEKEYRRKDGSVFPVELRTFLIRDHANQPVGMWVSVRDITKRKQAEEHLREYEKVVEGLQEMIVVVDRDYRYLIANRAFLEYRGMQREQLIGRRVPEVLDKGVFENLVKTRMDECFQGNVVIFEMKYTYPRLGERELLISYFPIAGPNGVDRLACVLQDITDRKQAEKALRDSETRYRLLFERNPAGMFRSTVEGKLLEANETFARMFGYSSRDELLGSPSIHFYQRPEERAPLIARLREQGALTDYEFCGWHRNGTPVWVLANMACVRCENGAPDVLEGTFIDVTRRKNAEKALQRSEAQLRAFIEHAPYGIFRYANDRFLSVNPTLLRMLGYDTEAEVAALRLSTDVFVEAAEQHRFLEMSAHQPYFGPLIMQWKRRQGGKILVRLSGRVVTDSQEQGQSVEAIVEDITQQHALEEHLRHTDKMEALGRLASGVAHDFNNLLLGITLNLEHAIAQAAPVGTPLREDIEQALQTARSAAAVTRQLLVFSRRRKLQQQSVNLNDVVIRSQALIKRLAGENIQIDIRLGHDLGPVTADPIQVQQIILNLVANARDAMRGTGQISIITRNIDLRQAPSNEYFTAIPKTGTYVVLEISDTGSGISRDVLSHIFEPFYTTKEEGSGLGLSTSYGIAAQSSGYMSVQTEQGQGTTLKLYLPRKREVSSDGEAAEA